MEIYLHHHIGQTHSFQWLGSSPVRDIPLFIRFLSYPFSVPKTMYLKTGLESISCSGHVSPVGGSISNLEKASWWQPVTICTFLSPLGVWGGVFLCLPKSEPPRWLRGAAGCGKRVGSWAHRWQMRRLDITKQNIKVLCCRNFKVNDAARSLQVTLAQGPIPVASCVFPDRRKVSGLKKPIL